MLYTLFAGLAFSFVAIAAWFQQKTLKAQNLQLLAAQEQQRLAELEPLFFQLISLFRDLQSKATKIDYPNPGSQEVSLTGAGVSGHIRNMAQTALRGDSLNSMKLGSDSN